MSNMLNSQKVLLVTQNLDLTFPLILILNKMNIKPYILGPKCNSFLVNSKIFCEKYIEYDIDEMGYTYSNTISSFGDGFIGLLNETYKIYNIDIMIPVDYTVTLTLSKYSNLIEKDINITAYINEKTLRFLNNKWNFSLLCKELNISQPETELLTSLRNISSLNTSFPIIVKPLNNGGGFGIKVLNSKQELENHVQQNNINLEKDALLVQNYIEGKDLQVFILAIEGELKAYSMCYMDKKGKREFIHNNKILNECKNIIKKSNYNGVGLIDIRCDSENNFYFLEINLRFPSSILYHFEAGINYVELLLMDSSDCLIKINNPVPNKIVRRTLLDTLLTKFNTYLLN